MPMAPCVVVVPYYYPKVLQLKQYRNPTTLKFFAFYDRYKALFNSVFFVVVLHEDAYQI
jgi:hypothetical protein